MRQLATIQQIADVQPIPGAGSIEVVKVKDWHCVAKKGEFHVGDKCVYFEIDSLLPSDNPVFEFLAKGTKTKTMNVDGQDYTGYRLKTIKLRGQLSQGLALPLGSFPHSFGLDFYDVGHDLSESFGIVKYEAPIPAQLSGKVKGNFPGFIPKTDEERIQNIGPTVARHQEAGTQFYVTEKLDGTSATFYRHTTNTDGPHFGVCSRNLELLEKEGNTHWEIAKRYKLMGTIPEGVAIQGEIVGEGVQKNPLKIKGTEFYAYNAYFINEKRFADFHEFLEMCRQIGVRHVPVLSTTTVLFGVDEMLKQADGMSAICVSAKREGLVYRPTTEMKDYVNGPDQRLSFKVISNDYLLSE